MGTKKILGVFILLSLVYVGLAFGLPQDSSALQRYDMSESEAQLLQLTFIVPLILIWAAAFYGYSLFQKYANTIRDTKEGKAWTYITGGLLGLALWLPTGGIIGQISSHLYNQDSDLAITAIILQNYINLGIVLGSFILLYRGANLLVKSVKKPLPNTLKSAGMAFLVVESGLFAFLTLTSDNKTVPVNDSTPAAYYLPDWLLVLTIVIPYIVIFYLGLRVVQGIYLYRKNVAGTLYKQSLRLLADGIGFIVLTVMAVRYLTALTSIFNESTLRFILFIVFLLIALIASGYVLIALGAKRMQKLEEV